MRASVMMFPTLAAYSFLSALGSAVLGLGALYLLAEYFVLKEKVLSPFVRRYGLGIALAAGVAAVAGSFVYSEVFSFVPCGLCWVERGFLYSLIVLIGIGLWKQRSGGPDFVCVDYFLGLSLAGALVSLYHHAVQMGTLSGVVCPTAGGDCARRLVFEFGFVTLPFMAFVTFLFLTAVFLVLRRRPAAHDTIGSNAHTRV